MNQVTQSKAKEGSKKKAAVIALIGVLAAAGIGGAVGTGAFFTDRSEVDGKVNVGTLDMKVDDLSDLDGNYRTWTTRLTSSSKLEKNGQQHDDFAMPTTADADAGQADSKGIINPGDTGILAFRVSNIAEKSMDTAAVVTVEVELPKGAYDDTKRDGTTKIIDYSQDGSALGTAIPTGSSGVDMTGASETLDVDNAKLAVDQIPTDGSQKDLALLADTTTDQGKRDAGAYTIEGLGTPVVYQGRFQRDARGEYTDKLIDTDKNVLTLRYYTTLETLKGSIENTDGKDDTHGAGNSVVYAYNADFDRALTNKFQNATIMVDCTVYAKQHRGGFTAESDFRTIGGSQGATGSAEASVSRVENTTGGKQTAEVTGLESGADETVTRAIDLDNGQSEGRSNVNKTQVVSAQVPKIDLSSDWSMIGRFNHVIDGSAMALEAPAANTVN